MTDEKLTALYNKANRLDPKRHNPITTERIFAAMREAILAERMEAELRCAKTQVLLNGLHGYTALKVQSMMMKAVSMRSNAALTGGEAVRVEGTVMQRTED